MVDAPAPNAPQDWLDPRGPAWRVVTGPELVCDNPWFAVDAYAATAPTGAAAHYYVHRCKNLATGVVALHEDATVTLVGQWRFPFGAYSWELPEGGAPHGEPPLQGAQRELREEAGLEAAHWREILTMQLSNASSDEVAHLFLATGLSPCAAAPDETEDLAVVRVPFQEALQAAVIGRIRDSLTVAGLLRLHHMAAGGELDPPLARRLLGTGGGRAVDGEG